MKAVTITGYFATGSGAVYNLLQEYSSISDGGLSAYEHIFLYDINGVFETVDRLLYCNRLYNSNHAINVFRKEMKRLNNVDFGWFGGYRYLVGNKFMNIIEEFITEITEYTIKREWYGTFVGRKYSFSRITKDIVKFILGKNKFNHNFGTYIAMDKENKGEFSFASKEKLVKATRSLVEKYLDIMYKKTDKTIILNHLLQPQDAKRLEQFMPEDMKMIIVDRDIRDLYVYNKYTNVWGGNTFPTDVDDFISFMKSYRATECKVDSNRILRVQFEDLIYKYEETVQKIEKFLEIDSLTHHLKKEVFVPEKSIKNTQIFLMDDAWKEEVDKVAKEFPDLVYDFPYDQLTRMEDLFDA